MSLPSFDPADYPAQLAEKLARFKHDFVPFELPEPTVCESATRAYRLRADSACGTTGRVSITRCSIRPTLKRAIVIDDFPPAAAR